MIFRGYCGADRDVGLFGVNSDGWIPECGSETDVFATSFEEIQMERRFCCSCGAELDPSDFVEIGDGE